MRPRDELKILENVRLAPFTTLDVGGPARYFTAVETEDQVLSAFRFAAEKDIDIFVLGGGSNILISDRGFGGLVVRIALKGTVFEQPVKPTPSVTRLTAAGGEVWDNLVAATVERGLAGFECLSGIPGSVGGTPVQNVGAYGQEVSETIVSVRCFDRRDGRIVELSNSDCRFSYRRSIFNSVEIGRYVVLAVTYELKNSGKPKLIYKDLLEIFRNREPSLPETREAVLGIRRAKSMVIDDKDPNSRSVGSFFKNPVVKRTEIERFRAVSGLASVPWFQAEDGFAKIPAAWLIENAGFAKGFRFGNAGISEHHTLALVNFGSAAAAEILKLKDLIQSGVEAKFGIRLEPEPILVGF